MKSCNISIKSWWGDIYWWENHLVADKVREDSTRRVCKYTAYEIGLLNYRSQCRFEELALEISLFYKSWFCFCNLLKAMKHSSIILALLIHSLYHYVYCIAHTADPVEKKQPKNFDRWALPICCKWCLSTANDEFTLPSLSALLNWITQQLWCKDASVNRSSFNLNYKDVLVKYFKIGRKQWNTAYALK